MKNGGLKSPKNDLGPLLRKLRLSEGWTQDEIIRRLRGLGWDCDRSKYGKIESRMVQVMDFQIVYFAHLFGRDFKEAFWHLQLRSLGSQGGHTATRRGGAR